jgi:hypothetical protein
MSSHLRTGGDQEGVRRGSRGGQEGVKRDQVFIRLVQVQHTEVGRAMAGVLGFTFDSADTGIQRGAEDFVLHEAHEAQMLSV